MRELADSGQVQAGSSVFLDSVPIPFLREAPLVHGRWLDRLAVELAEWGALLQRKGYRFQEAEDGHPLALVVLNRDNGKEADPAEIGSLRRRASHNLAKFPGRARKIDGRMYLHFDDYRSWPGRKVKGDLLPNVKEGMVTVSWNKWVSDHGGEGVVAIAGVPVEDLQCYVGGCSYYSCPNGTEEQHQQRERLLDGMRLWRRKPERKAELIREWEFTVGKCLMEVYAFQQALTLISNKYFDGQQILFNDSIKDLAEVIKEAEKTVDNFNCLFDDETELLERMDLEPLRQSANKVAAQQMVYIVDMAKAEALDAMGERQASIELAGRYL